MLNLFGYMKEVIYDPNNSSPSQHRYTAMLAGWTLCIGFMVSLIAFIAGVAKAEPLILPLGGILATMASANYISAKTSAAKVAKASE